MFLLFGYSVAFSLAACGLFFGLLLVALVPWFTLFLPATFHLGR